MKNGLCVITSVTTLYLPNSTPTSSPKTLFDVENASNFQGDYTAIGDINAEEFYGPMLEKGGKDRGQRPKKLILCET